MAFDALYAEVNSAGSDTANGGAFCYANTSFPTDLAATSATGSSPVVTSASYTFVAGDVGHCLFVKSGTNWTPGFYPIASVSAGAATLTASVGSVVLYNGTSAKNTVAGCATTASPTAGTWGIDYSRSTTARITFTDMAIDATTNTKFTSAGNPVGVNFVGNLIVVTSGTGFTTQRVEVVSVSGTTATCDKSLGTLSSTGGHGGLGGALASPGAAGAIAGPINNTIIFVLGNHTFSFSNSSNVSGGFITLNASNNAIVGYTANRHPFNLDANRPVFQSSANSMSLVKIAGGGSASMYSVDVENGNANTSVVGFDDSQIWGPDYLFNCKFHGVSIAAYVAGSGAQVEYCWIDSCTNSTTLSTGASTVVKDCVFTSNAGVGLSCVTVVGCVFYGTTGSVSDTSTASLVDRCLFHSHSAASSQAVFNATQVSNSIFVSTTGSGSNAITWNVAAPVACSIVDCAFYNNTNDINPTNIPGFRVVGKITLTGDPITNAAGGDFSLNNTAGAGALLRGAAFPTTFANSLTASALDVGPAQHAAAAGGGAAHLAGRGGGLAA